MRTFLTDFQIYLPPFKADQDDTINWLKELHQKRDPAKAERIEKFIKKFGVDAEKIGTRRSFIADFEKRNFNDHQVFSIENDFNPDLSQRSQVAQLAFEQAFEELYLDDSNSAENILHVSCTHYESPSAAQKSVLNRNSNSVVTHLYHMGCYAALPAIRTANALANQGRVDIVHTEICSIHLNCESYSPEQLVVQSLFADGAIKYQCLHENEFLNQDKKGLEILSLHEILVPDTQEDMTWKLHSDRFDMTLSKNVPKYLAEYLSSFMQELFSKANLNYQDEKEQAIFAIHPGGPKIIELSQDLLNLRDDQVLYSKDVLYKRGNMSSATLPHIWKNILENENDKLVATVAFGPGLTMTGSLLKIC